MLKTAEFFSIGGSFSHEALHQREKIIQQRSINHHKNNGYKIKVYLQDNLKSFSSQPVLFSWLPRLARSALPGARWWNYYIKLRNRRARCFLQGKILATQWVESPFQSNKFVHVFSGIVRMPVILDSTLLWKLLLKKGRIMLKKKGWHFVLLHLKWSTVGWNGNITTERLPGFKLNENL